MDEPTSPDAAIGTLRDLIAGGRYRDALDAFRSAERAGVRDEPEAVLLAATAATRLGELEAGASLAGAALESFRARTDDDGRMRVMNLLGAIAFERGDLTRAEERFDEALRMAEQTRDS